MMMDVIVGLLLTLLACAPGVGFWIGFKIGRKERPVRPPPLTPSTALIERARQLVLREEAGPGDGESRRHRVYAKLIKEFPAVSRRVLSRAIEDSLP